jgi:hypothetical protein
VGVHEPGGPAIWPLNPSNCSVPSLIVPTSAIAERKRQSSPPAFNAVGCRELLAVPVDAHRSFTFGSLLGQTGAEMGTYELDYPYSATRPLSPRW